MIKYFSFILACLLRTYQESLCYKVGALLFRYRILCPVDPTLQRSVTFVLRGLPTVASVSIRFQVYQRIFGLSKPCLLASAIDNLDIEWLSGSIGERATVVTAPIVCGNSRHSKA